MKGVPDISTKELGTLVGGEVSLTRLFGRVDGGLLATFQIARNEKAHRKAQQEAQAEKHREAADKDRQQAQNQATDLTIFVQVLDQIEQRIAYLEEEMARRYEILKAKYGEDVIGGMAATYLTEQELAGLKTDEEKNYALAAKFLDRSGKIKPEYKHLEDARYIRDWYENEQLKGVAHKIKSGQTLNAEDKTVLQNGNFTDTRNLRMLTDDAATHEIVDEIRDADRAEQAAPKTDINFTF